MSMNFGREQSLLRQRLQAAGSTERAGAMAQQHGAATTFLGAPADAVRAAADDLTAAHPQMGRAQMTAFVRTLWQTKIHELRAVGVEVLAARAALLEPADLPFLEGLLPGCDTDSLAARLAGDVLGALVARNKKLWKDLRRLGSGAGVVQRRAAVRACRQPLLADPDSFARFAELAEPLLGDTDATLLAAIDQLLAAAAAVHVEAVSAFAAKHGRKVVLPKKRKPAPATAGSASARKAPATRPAAKRTPPGPSKGRTRAATKKA